MRKITFLLLLFLFFGFCTKTSINPVFDDPEVYKWKNISQDLINSCDTIEINDLHTAAYLMYSNGNINGWENELTVKYYLRSLEILEENSYGLQYEWDAFQDGTLNSDTTNYTITMTDHLGLPFIEGYKNKLVNDNELLNIFEKLLLIPKADSIQDGICFAYSDSPNDQVGCVHNVNISLNREKTISSLIVYLRVLPINDFDADSLYNDLETIINKSDTIYISENSYFIESTRIKSQLALWTAIYYRHLINEAINS